MVVKAFKCPKCNCLVFSRAPHDFRSCDCGGLSIDGGPGAERIVGRGVKLDGLTSESVEVDATAKILHDDWNYRHDRYGLIRQS